MCHLNHLIDTFNLFPTSFSSYYFFPPRFLCLLYNFSKQSFNLFSLQIPSMLFWLLFFSLWIIYKTIIIFQFHCPLIFLHLSYLDFGFFYPYPYFYLFYFSITSLVILFHLICIPDLVFIFLLLFFFIIFLIYFIFQSHSSLFYFIYFLY